MRTAAAVLLVGSVLLAVPDAGHASCAQQSDRPSLADHDQVFAGHVERTTHGGAAAEVRVLDVWHGPDLPPSVVVIGGQLGRGVESSVDRTYRAGERYAFFVYRGDDGSLRDNSCTPTGRLASLADLDPPGVRAPEASAVTPTDPRGVLTRAGLLGVSAGVAAAGLATAAGVALRRRRHRVEGSGREVT